MDRYFQTWNVVPTIVIWMIMLGRDSRVPPFAARATVLTAIFWNYFAALYFSFKKEKMLTMPSNAYFMSFLRKTPSNAVKKQIASKTGACTTAMDDMSGAV